MKNNKPEEHILVIFGATGDLGKRKLIPALYALYVLNLLPDKSRKSHENSCCQNF